MVSDLVSQNINIFLRNTVKVTGVVVFMFSLSWQLSLVTFMGFPIIMMVSDIYGKYYKVRSPVHAGPCEHGLLPRDPWEGGWQPWGGGSEGLVLRLCLLLFSCSVSQLIFTEHLRCPRHQDTTVTLIETPP